MQKDEITALIERYIKAYNQFNLPEMTALLHKHIVFENYSGKTLTHSTAGIAEFRKLAERASVIFSERHQSMDKIEFDYDGKAHVYIDYQAVLAENLSEELKAGDILNLKGKSIFGFQDNLISYIADYS